MSPGVGPQQAATIDEVIEQLDGSWNPGPVARLTTGFIRFGERGTVREIIDLLL